MLNQIVDALNRCTDLAGWTVRHVQSREAQVYAVPQGTESQRSVDGERYLIDVLRSTSTADGSRAVGSGDAALLPGDDIERALDQAALVAGLVSNPVYGMPGPAVFPDVPLCDDKLQNKPMQTMLDVLEKIQAETAKHRDVQLTAAECFGEIRHTHLINSRGIDIEQEATNVNIEYVLHSRRGDVETETFIEVTRRRVSDLDLETSIQDRMQYTIDSFDARPPASWQGPVVMRGDLLALFLAGEDLNGSVIQTLASAAAKYARFSPWEVGKSVFRGEVLGDPLTVWANRLLPI